MTSRRALMARVQSGGGRLPAEYQEVEYLNGIGGQYLITDINAYDISKIIIKSMPTNHDGFLLSTTYGTNYKGINYYIDAADRYWYYYGPKTKLTQGAYNQISVAVFDVRFENGIAISSVATIDGISTPEFFFNQIPIDALICLGSANGRYGFPGRIYESIFYRNAITVGDFVPCYRKSDNKPGMYNTATSTFIVNSGTGDYGVGPDIN